MDTPNECAGHNYDCDVLELIVLDLRASQAKKIVAQLRSCSRTLHDLKHWTPSQVSAFLKEVFPEAAEAKVANMMKRLQPVLRRDRAAAAAADAGLRVELLAGTDAEAPSKLPPMSMSWSPTASSTPSSPLTPLTPLAAPAGFDRRESKAAKHRAAITHADMGCPLKPSGDSGDSDYYTKLLSYQGLGLQNLDKSFQIYRARLDSFLKMEAAPGEQALLSARENCWMAGEDGSSTASSATSVGVRDGSVESDRPQTAAEAPPSGPAWGKDGAAEQPRKQDNASFTEAGGKLRNSVSFREASETLAAIEKEPEMAEPQ
eukprot:CAMPEP_0174313030 /NCGR_PEP_ID=MMETSP0810-20121108/4703_1 /TAXON_ID=73025 ORGANISM="Eutreptiella gymnastica-like, Strain CCMP1594" /NCGR_SAMPLE_ID=MMETSP0810 /ASSEMBLY_ACC=CAM_ASM_000659 /LENGTH=316 /DNA_ID=CAMNT_0015421657 /DNA_START=17 /DNA_END=965 /DNA_ORIENTATION=+